MTAVRDPPAASSRLWSFSLAFYEHQGVAAALTELQDGAGLDVNLILFSLWLGWSGRGRFDEHGLEAADRAVGAIRVDVIEPLRALRRRLKTAADTDIRRLRERVKALELDAEKAAQDRLAALAGPALETDCAECLVDAEANLVRCLGSAAAQGDAAAVLRGALTRFAEKTLSRVQTAHPTA
jgi:uncharacterized protein (TIGR02444 family)